ncbi:hypothetical protein GCM10009555_035240 [Acrocarpospora macrocephala]|uniref:Hint domain-containing protein n=1 Tax=Acrocarpospora macrocephala TaxID=150177 RepID=A0A5M3WCC1_9ACTN|nr:polymorphic toxin-type HINT domain-containing protein [Acrocarpospora macrocephala]GES06707.1 hypothetical protein Amac_003020 [Acrocarpospora macrocephala]
MKRWLAPAVACLLVLTLSPTAAAGVLPDPEDLSAPAVQREKSVPGSKILPAIPAPLPKVPELSGTRAVTWPKPGAVTVQTGTAFTKAGALPISVAPAASKQNAPPSRVRVEVLPRAGDGLLFRTSKIDETPATAAFEVDYSGFRGAFGGDWASRLELRTLPECALTTPGLPKCQGRAVPAQNDVKAGKISSELPLGGLYALAAAPSGSAGTFAATGLSPSSTWGAGGSTGDFTWNYPLRVPPGLGGPTPSIALSYSSGSVDGRTVATNNQPSWVGEGFEWWPGFIERRYKPCSEDGKDGVGDQCWETDNATLSLNGGGSELVKDDKTGVWRPRNDDGSRIERLTDTTRANGDNDGEYWRVTTTDGTQYYFGMNRLPSWTTGKTETGSTWTLPVYGNETGEPCHAITYCTQAWRWNLDYVVDPHGNVMTYWYNQEKNLYGRDADPAKATEYVRGGTLARIDYGLRTGQEYAGTPAAQVVFTAADRCLPGTACDITKPEQWSDTPLDQRCAAAPCTGVLTPTFWSQKRLASVTTQIWNGTGFTPVDTWTLRHTFPDPGDGTRAGLWLAGLTHAGTGDAVMPEIKFTPQQLDNRVIGPDGRPPMRWPRVGAIENETGGDLRVTYSTKDCVSGTRMPPSPDTNTYRCHPVKGAYPGQPDKLEWFHKYVVTEVTENDYVGGGAQIRTFYNYPEAPAWHFDDADGLVAEEDKTWAQWRGYEVVETTRGVTPDVRTFERSRFFRGMDGDRTASGGRKTVKIRDSEGVEVADNDRYAGMPREEITYNGVSGAEVSATISDPWLRETASAVHSWGTVTASLADVGTTRVRTPKAGGGTFQTRVDKEFNDQGLTTRVHEHGDTAVGGDEKCTTFTYARNETLWLLSATSRVETYALPCGQNPTGDEQVIADVRMWHDATTAWNTPATKGDVTKVEELKTWPSTYLTKSRAAFDLYGRVTESWDQAGERSTTSYEPATGGPLRAYVSTNPLDHTTRTELNPAWGLPTKTVDANDRTTEIVYDGLGRISSGWEPGRDTGQPPNVRYTYDIRGRTGPPAVTTRSLRADGGYTVMIELYDGLLRTRQTQIPGPNGGRIISDTLYNSLGQSHKQNGAYWNAAAPVTDLFGVKDADVPGQNRSTFDGAGRTIAEAHLAFAVERWRSATAYPGADRVDVTPPAGGTATTAIMDALGRTKELRQYQAATPTGAYDTTRYAFTRAGRLETVTDPAGNIWKHAYDLRGREIRTDDPDRGSTRYDYDDADRLISTEDARHQILAYAYDKLGRRTAIHEGTLDGPKRASWTYDTLESGMLTSASRFSGGNEYSTSVTGYDVGYRPTGSTVTIPASEGALAGTYTYGSTFNTDGTVATMSLPGVGSLAGETLSYGYDAFGNPLTLSGQSSYVSGSAYSDMSELGQLTLGTGGKRLWLTYTYEVGSRRLTGIHTKREAAGAVQGDVRYTYDHAGNVTKVVDAPGATGVPTDTQCFGYDHLRRLKEAWTPDGANCATPTSANVGGPAPYWTSYGYDKIGNRTSEVRHAVAGGTQVDKTFDYPDPAAGEPQPHTLRGVTVSDSTGTRTLAYDYDKNGNTTTRPSASGAPQTLTWDAEGRLSAIQEGAAKTEFVYDAAGNRLIRKDADGSATLYLPGQELRAKGTVKSGTRYYAHGGTTVAVRTDDGKLTWLSADRFGTAQLAFAATDLAVTRRRFTPFGETRGAGTTWPGSTGFVDGVQDPTGLTHLGAREYDPVTGRFLSVDPLIDVADPQQMHGYAYAGSSPVTFADPDGLMHVAEDSGGRSDAGGSAPPDPGPSDEEIEEAKEVTKKGVLDIVLETGGDILMEVLGINDIRNCFTKGDVVACVSMVAGMFPLGKLLKARKIAKALHRAYEAYRAFDRKLAAARNVLARAARKADEAAEAVAETTAKAADDVAAAAAKQADEAVEGAAETVDDLGGSCALSNSFAPGTLVLMADGSRRPIEEIEPGDEVLATDPETDATEAKPVTATIEGTGAKVLVDITFATGATVTATDGHPFWLERESAWVDAADLEPGDRLLDSSGDQVRVNTVTVHEQAATVHNLTVADTHTYYVASGRTDALVHNAGGGKSKCGGGSNHKDNAKQNRQDYSTNKAGQRPVAGGPPMRVAPRVIQLPAEAVPTAEFLKMRRELPGKARDWVLIKGLEYVMGRDQANTKRVPWGPILRWILEAGTS